MTTFISQLAANSSKFLFVRLLATSEDLKALEALVLQSQTEPSGPEPDPVFAKLINKPSSLDAKVALQQPTEFFSEWAMPASICDDSADACEPGCTAGWAPEMPTCSSSASTSTAASSPNGSEPMPRQVVMILCHASCQKPSETLSTAPPPTACTKVEWLRDLFVIDELCSDEFLDKVAVLELTAGELEQLPRLIRRQAAHCGIKLTRIQKTTLFKLEDLSETLNATYDEYDRELLESIGGE